MVHGTRPLLLGVTLTALLAAVPTRAYTPTPTFAPPESPRPTGTPTEPAPPRAVIVAVPDPARPGQRVVLDGNGSDRGSYFQWSQVGGDVAIEIEDAGAAVASFIVPPLSAPAEVTVELYIGRGVPTQRTVSLLPADTVRLEVDTVTGAPGFPVEFTAKLRPLGYPVTEVRHELRFDGFAPVAGSGATPDCTPGGGDLLTESFEFVFLPENCTPDIDCTSMRATIVTREPIADGLAVYRCNVVSHEQVAGDVDCFHPLVCAGGEARTSGGTTLAIDCLDGGVNVDHAVRPLTFNVSVEPALPDVGDSVRITVSASGVGGIPAYFLSGAEPYLRITSRPPPPGGPLGTPVVFEAVADCPGVANLRLGVSYEARCGCSINPFFCFTGASFPTYAIPVREPGTRIVYGRVAEFPLACQGAMRGVTVRLDPLGLTTQTDLVGGNFSFGSVPPGDYTLSVEPACNPFGCWPPQSIQVGDFDYGLDVCPERQSSMDCPGDCDGDGRVMVHELVASVSIAFGVDDVVTCRAADSDASGIVAIDDLTRAIGRALEGCPQR